MDEQLQPISRIEQGEPFCVEQLGGPVWICLAKVKGRQQRSLPSLPWLGGDSDLDPMLDECTETLAVVQGRGKDPSAALSDLNDRVRRYSSRPPPPV